MLEIFDEIKSNLDCELIQKVFNKVKQKFDLPDNVSVELTIVGEEDIQAANREFRGVDGVTDVLSFPALEVTLPFNDADYPYDVDLTSGELMLGEIMLCYKRALEQSEEYGHSKERECCFLVLHGLLHLLGFDHIQEEDRVKMREQEEEILTELNILRD